MPLNLTPIPPKNTKYSLMKADRELSIEELETEEKSERYSVTTYKRIKPVVGTLGYLFRNFSGGNEGVMELIKSSRLPITGVSKAFKQLIILWNEADEYSRKRVDIFDVLCLETGVRRDEFWGLFQQSSFLYNKIVQEMAIQAATADLIDNVFEFAKKETHTRDRELGAKIAGLATEKPLVQINDNSQTVNNNLSIKDSNVGFSFDEMIRKGDKVISGERPQYEIDKIEAERKQLTEGDTDYVDGEVIEEREKELMRRKA